LPDPQTLPHRDGLALRSGRAWILFGLIAVAAAGADLATKQWAFDSLMDRAQRVDWRKVVDSPLPPEQRTVEYTRYVMHQLDLSAGPVLGVHITLSTNPGVVFGIDYLPDAAVSLITAGMIGMVVVFFATSPRRSPMLHVALALILGGAVGNLYDRLFSYVALPHLPPIEGHVRDFIDCSGLGYPWIFNLADAWLVVGVALVMLHWLLAGRAQARAEAAAKDSAA
jgi:signal peptidase II